MGNVLKGKNCFFRLLVQGVVKTGMLKATMGIIDRLKEPPVKFPFQKRPDGARNVFRPSFAG